jgi:hypothetical protein
MQSPARNAMKRTPGRPSLDPNDPTVRFSLKIPRSRLERIHALSKGQYGKENANKWIRDAIENDARFLAKPPPKI